MRLDGGLLEMNEVYITTNVVFVEFCAQFLSVLNVLSTSRGTIATHLRCGGNYCMHFIINLIN